jgi:hypothetical protein
MRRSDSYISAKISQRTCQALYVATDASATEVRRHVEAILKNVYGMIGRITDSHNC